ncbi:MAG TPA: glutaredoxin [Polyangiaceae bacterium]|nr:glutaredoxin [Polyangiaceae bacterium]
MQCERHGIAAGPDGQCALCRRASPDRLASVPPQPKLGLWLAGLGLGLLTVAVLLARSLSAPSTSGVQVAAEVTSATAVPVASSEPEPEGEGLAAPPPEEPKPDEPADLADASADSAATAATSSALALAGAPSASAESPRLPESPNSPTRPTQAALTNAVRATPIVMFSTDWCPVCSRARAFLSANGMSYTERDIDHDERAREELKRRTGKSSIPTLEIDGKLLTPGFSEQAVMAAVAASVQRRLGLQNVEVRSP